jgi:hypothetical protein
VAFAARHRRSVKRAGPICRRITVPIRRSLPRASACLLVGALLGGVTLAAVPGAGAAPAPSSAVSASSTAACYGYRYSDTRGDATLDGVAYGLDYDCASDRWQGWVQTAAAFSASQLGFLELDFDTDLNVHTGCNGADWAVYATYDGNGGVHGIARHFTTTSCSSYANVSAPLQAFADRSRGSNTVEVSSVGGPLTFDRSLGFRWWMRLAATNGSVDRLPDGTGMRSYVPTGSNAFVDRAVANVNGTYRLVGGDFNGDGYGDILFYGPGTAPDAIWYGDPAHAGFHGGAVAINGVFDKVIAGDFNGDGRSDLLFYGAGTRPDVIWFSKAGGGFTAKSIALIGSYNAIVAGDFNGDHVSDLLLYRAGHASDAILTFHHDGSYTQKAVTLNGNYTSVVSGDFDGDGRADILFYTAGTATDYLWRGQANGSFVGSTLKIDGVYNQLVVGDFDSDGRSDVLCYGRGTAPDRLLKGSPVAPYFVSGPAVNIDESYTDVVAGRFDGNTTSDLFFYSAGSGPERWWVSTL